MRVQRIAKVVPAALLAALLGVATGTAEEPDRLYLTVDKTQVISFQSVPISKISVTNPSIADVHVTSPTQVLMSGKTPGRTSLLVFQADRISYFDVIVHPAPAATPKARLVPNDEHGVEVLRAGKVSHQLFVRDTERAWIQLGAPQAEPEVAKK